MTRFLRFRTSRLLLAALLLALAAAANARDVRMHGPNGDGGSCPEVAVTQDTRPAAVQPRKRAPSGANEDTKAAPMMRSTGDSNVRPRWHSLLPGMFR